MRGEEARMGGKRQRGQRQVRGCRGPEAESERGFAFAEEAAGELKDR